MEKLIFATGNEGKMKEIREILGRPGLTILSQREAGIVSDAEENGTTFEANALIKARLWRPRRMPWCWRMIPAWKLII